MKIVLSADWFYPAQMGGPSNAIYWQAKALTQAGHLVTVVATSQDLPASVPVNRWLMMDCGRVIYTKNVRFYIPLTHIWYGWQAIRQTDVVHVNSLFYPASFMWILMAIFWKKSIVWSPHGELSSIALQFRPRLKRRLLSVFRWVGHRVHFHATCAAEVSQIQYQFGPDVWVDEIQNSLELPPLAKRVAQPYLLFIGRLHPIKAIDRLLLALSASEIFGQSAYRLLLAGPDADKAYTQSLKELVVTLNLSAKVSFVGLVQGEQKQQLYADARLMILPSHSENFGNVVMESLAQGTPVIAATGTPWQVLDKESIGGWVPNDPTSLRQAIELFLTMPAEPYEQCRNRALHVARRDYTVDATTDVWEGFYERVKNYKHPKADGLYAAAPTQ